MVFVSYGVVLVQVQVLNLVWIDLRHFSKEIKKRNKFDPVIKKQKDIPYLVDQHLLDKNA